MSHCEIFDVRPAVAGMQASTPPPLATSATCATASRAAVGSGVGAVWRPRRVLGCLRTLPPEGGVPGSRVETAPCLACLHRGGGRQGRLGLGRRLLLMHRPAGKPLEQNWRG